MTKKEQIDFVKKVTKNVTDSIISDIKHGATPNTWDGFELRQLLADSFKPAALVKMKGKRLRDYQNSVIVNNL